jgi:hypothetical protein
VTVLIIYAVGAPCFAYLLSRYARWRAWNEVVGLAIMWPVIAPFYALIAAASLGGKHRGNDA